MQTIKIRSLVIASTVLASAASLVGATAAQADVPHKVVRYSDLDLQSRNGQKALARRVNLAAYSVCSTDEGSDRWAAINCRSNAVNRAYADLEARGVPKF